MEISNNYEKKEDFALWELHVIRHKMAEKKIDLKSIHLATQEIIKKYNLKNLKFISKQELSR